MRHAFIVLAAAGFFTLLSASEASAQRFGFGNRGGRGYSNGFGNNGNYGGGTYYPSNYGYSNYGNQSYGPYYQGSSYSNVFRLGGFGFSRTYSSPYNAQPYYAQPYYSTSYDYPLTTSGYQDLSTGTPLIVQSQFPVSQAYATIAVSVPTPGTQVWFGDTLMAQQGTQRTYQSTLLDAGTTYAYTITARWMVEGKLVEQSRKIEVLAGKTSEVQFGSTHRELIPTPLTSGK